ncbi:MAG: helix-hairpin-helix domain-containing protein [Candidatus Thorarchaeota archaeon]
MSKKKSKKKKPATVQSTLGDLVESKPKKKAAAKKSPAKKKTTTKKAAPKKKDKPKAKPKPAAKKPKKPTAKKTTKKKPSAKKSPAKKKTTPKKVAPKKKPEPSPISESGIPITKLPGVGSKLADKLIAAKYDTVEKISRSRAPSLSKKIDGLSRSGAQKLVDAAKDLIKKKDQPAKADPETLPDDEAPRPTIKLSEVPGVGSKMALSLERAGYNSVARLSRSRPDAVASKVDGLSIAGASKIVTAAKDMMQRMEMERITGESTPTTVVASKEIKPPKEKKAPVKKETTKLAEKAPAKKKPKKKTRRKKADEKKLAKKLAPPKRKKPKAIKKSSGLPVPKSVIKLTEDIKEKWIAADKRAKAPKSADDPEQVETVQVVSLSPDDTLERLVENALEILNETMTTGRPAFEIPSRSGDNIVWDEIRDLLLLGMKTISRPYHSLASVVDATRTARVMEIIFNLLQANLHATKREVFYSDVNLFRDQKYSDKIIEDVSSMLRTTRDSVHVVASARGSAMGRVTIRDGGDLIDLTKMGTGGWAVTPFLDQLEIVESDAEFILLSEKDAAVMRLSEAKYWNRQPCIVLTGKGSGDIATRAFLKMLVKELEIPAFALVDSDPYGHYIYSVFLRGSKRLSYESPFIATPDLKLLGVLSRDLDEYKIPKAVRIPMQPTDIKRVKDMLKEPFVQQNKEWVKDLKLMLQLKEKAEIQAFASHSFQYLTDEYLPRKLETGDWI